MQPSEQHVLVKPAKEKNNFPCFVRIEKQSSRGIFSINFHRNSIVGGFISTIRNQSIDLVR